MIESLSFKGKLDLRKCLELKPCLPPLGPSQTIKSHHNVGGLPAAMRLKLIEPLRELFKDEVRILVSTSEKHLEALLTMF